MNKLKKLLGENYKDVIISINDKKYKIDENSNLTVNSKILDLRDGTHCVVKQIQGGSHVAISGDVYGVEVGVHISNIVLLKLINEDAFINKVKNFYKGGVRDYKEIEHTNRLGGFVLNPNTDVLEEYNMQHPLWVNIEDNE